MLAAVVLAAVVLVPVALLPVVLLAVLAAGPATGVAGTREEAPIDPGDGGLTGIRSTGIGADSASG